MASAIIADELDISAPAQLAVLAHTGNIDRTFPITRIGGELLIRHDRPYFNIERERRRAQPPPSRIASTAWAFPVIEDVDLHVLVGQRPRAPVGRDPRAGTERIATLHGTQRIEHERAAVRELQRKPVPALLIGAERAAAPF